MVGFKIIKEVSFICQPKKISILSEKDLVSQQYGIFKQYSYKRPKIETVKQ